jgi:hypothetical protein
MGASGPLKIVRRISFKTRCTRINFSQNQELRTKGTHLFQLDLFFGLVFGVLVVQSSSNTLDFSLIVIDCD